MSLINDEIAELMAKATTEAALITTLVSTVEHAKKSIEDYIAAQANGQGDVATLQAGLSVIDSNIAAINSLTSEATALDGEIPAVTPAPSPAPAPAPEPAPSGDPVPPPGE